MRYWFVRHGESVANAERWLAGHRDVDLTDAGVQQARVLRSSLLALLPDRVLSSDLLRARRTASMGWDHRLPPVVLAPEARERALGAWEGRTIDELRASGDDEVLLSWSRGPPGGESHERLAVRALTFLDQIEDGRDTLLFGHGGWIRAVAGLLDGVPTEDIGKYKVGNTEIVAREVEPGTWARLLRAIG